MPSIDINAIITKPVDELENERTELENQLTLLTSTKDEKRVCSPSELFEKFLTDDR